MGGVAGRRVGVGARPGPLARARAGRRRRVRERPVSAVGPGAGRSSVVGCDVSAGMLAGVDRVGNGCLLVQADAQSLPLATGSVDVALAMHMLYHVPNVVTAVGELRRVVRPGGTLVAMTNGCDHQAELQALASDAMSAVAGTRVERPSIIAGFTFENGEAQLAAAFTQVEAHELRGGVAVPEVGRSSPTSTASACRWRGCCRASTCGRRCSRRSGGGRARSSPRRRLPRPDARRRVHLSLTAVSRAGRAASRGGGR